ncbi:hypothetical protein DF186_23025, partial [Enterococcus hirae]
AGDRQGGGGHLPLALLAAVARQQGAVGVLVHLQLLASDLEQRVETGAYVLGGGLGHRCFSLVPNAIWPQSAQRWPKCSRR